MAAAAATAYRTPFSVDKTGQQEGIDHITLKANNGGPLPDIGFLRPSTTDLPIEELRKRYEEDGYLWMKALLDPAAVLHMREQYFTFMSTPTDSSGGGDTGILAPHTHPRDGIFSPTADWRAFLLPGALRVFNNLPDSGVFVDKVIQAHVADFYHDFKQRVGSTLTGFAGRLREFKEPMLLNRSLLRCNVPGGETTPVHYDQIFLRGAPASSVTGWVPLGECAVEGGGLMYLEGSVEVGRRFEADFAERSKELEDEEERVSAFNRNMNAGGFLDRDAAAFGRHWGRRWLMAPRYEAGDVVFHDPFMVHASCKNESPEGIIRLSTDLRFVDGAEPFDERWMFEAYQKDDPNVASRQKKVPPAEVAKEALEPDAESPLGVNH